MILRILHISDLCFESKKINPVNSFEEGVVFRGIIDVVRTMTLKGRGFDLIIISGDVAAGGKKEGYDEAGAFCSALGHVTDLPNSRFFVVPGEQDMERAEITEELKPNYMFDTQEKINGKFYS